MAKPIITAKKAEELAGKLFCLAGIHPHLNETARNLINEAADIFYRMSRQKGD